MKNKILLIVVAIAMLFTITGCGKTETYKLGDTVETDVVKIQLLGAKYTYALNRTMDSEYGLPKEYNADEDNGNPYVAGKGNTLASFEFYIENMTEDELIKFEMEKDEETINRVLDFQNKIFENAPFIPVDLFERYENLSLIANNILKNRLANLNKLAKGDSNIKNIKDVTSEDDREKITNFIADYSKLNVEVRAYLNSMKLVE